MTTNISRRDFMKIIFGTTAAAVTPATALWPEGTKVFPEGAHSAAPQGATLPVAEPYEFEVDQYGYLVDPSFDWEIDWPTVRESLGYDTHSLEEKVKLFEDRYGAEELLEYADKPLSQWNEENLADLESIYSDWLDEPQDPESMSFYQSARHSEYWPGVEVFDVVGFQEANTMGLFLVVGDQPGSSFCGVRFEGNLDDLNIALSEAGLNMVVTRGT